MSNAKRRELSTTQELPRLESDDWIRFNSDGYAPANDPRHDFRSTQEMPCVSMADLIEERR